MSRSDPPTPTKLWWAPSIPIQYVTIDGVKLRYIEAGSGPNLVLLHTLRTQIDIFHKTVLKLSETFRVYALDYPGHGYSEILETDYTPQFFTDSVEKFLQAREIEHATIAGVSIGASIALMLAARRNPRVDRVVAINPYDYLGGGVGRGNLVAKAVVTMFKLPIFGPVAMLLNNRMIERKVLEGGVANPRAMSKDFLNDVFLVGTRKGYSRAFLNLVSHFDKWNDIKNDYPKINVPVLVVYGDEDWAYEWERNQTTELIPSARVETVSAGGHFLPIDQPDQVIRLIRDFKEMKPH